MKQCELCSNPSWAEGRCIDHTEWPIEDDVVTCLDCDNTKIKARGLCKKHYLADLKQNPPVKKVCKICGGKVKGYGYCEKHYRKLYNHGLLGRTTL